MKRFTAWLLAVLAAVGMIGAGIGEEETETREMFVTASLLNGRAYPTKKSHKEAFFDFGEWITCTGRWSDDHLWVEIVGGETGTVWCKAEYLTERTERFRVVNEGHGKVKIRSKPVNGKIVGYLKKGKKVEITQVVLGWGKCKSGWIDLDYLIEEE